MSLRFDKKKLSLESISWIGLTLLVVIGQGRLTVFVVSFI